MDGSRDTELGVPAWLLQSTEMELAAAYLSVSRGDSMERVLLAKRMSLSGPMLSWGWIRLSVCDCTVKEAPPACGALEAADPALEGFLAL